MYRPLLKSSSATVSRQRGTGVSAALGRRPDPGERAAENRLRRALLPARERGRGEKIGRYSFIGSHPFLTFKAFRNQVTVSEALKETSYEADDPMDELKKLLSRYSVAHVEGLPRFTSGAVGYFAYDVVRYTEDLPNAPPTPGTCRHIRQLLRHDVIFDHIYKSVKVVHSVRTDGRDVREAYDEAVRKIDAVCDMLRKPSTALADDIAPTGEVTLDYTSNFTRKDFCKVVERCKDYIRAGDIFQVVPSQRLCATTDVDAFDIYRVLRVINPSPYMFYLNFDDVKLVGSSPEVMVRVEDGQVTLRPIAGTRPRGKTEEEDRQLARELLATPRNAPSTSCWWTSGATTSDAWPATTRSKSTNAWSSSVTVT